jgi:Taurine catabolism dioxygenase TauD, TfdA family
MTTLFFDRSAREPVTASFPARIDFRPYLNIIAPRIARLGVSKGPGWMPLVDETPAEADRIIGAAFANDSTLWEIGELLKIVLWGRCGAVIAILGDANDDPVMLRKLQLLVGYALGTNANLYSEDQPHRALFELTPRPDVRYGGNGENASSIGPHTDGSGVGVLIDILGLGCIHQTESPGGQTLIIDALRAVLSLTTYERALLSEPWPRTNPYDAQTPTSAFVRRPIAVVRDPFEFSFHGQRVRQALDRCGEATWERLQTLANLDAALWRHSTPVKLQTGELLLLNNRRVAHGRVGFVHDSANPRRIERQWIKWRWNEDPGRGVS